MVWASTSSQTDLAAEDRDLVESLVPDGDDEDWSPALAYLQNAAAATAYAVSVALEGDMQNAFWSVWQVYDLADFEAMRINPDLDLNTESGRESVTSSDVVQAAISGIHADVRSVRQGIDAVELRERVRADSARWAQLFAG
jgi:hypothetical protein